MRLVKYKVSWGVVVVMLCVAAGGFLGTRASGSCDCNVCTCLKANCHAWQVPAGTISCYWYTDEQARNNAYVWGSAQFGYCGDTFAGTEDMTDTHLANNCTSYCLSDCPGSHEGTCTAGEFLVATDRFDCPRPPGS
jgi:hypothetical protein